MGEARELQGILLAEDNAAIAALTREVLEDAGYRINGSPNPRQSQRCAPSWLLGARAASVRGGAWQGGAMPGASRRGFDALGASLAVRCQAGQTCVTLAFATLETTLLRRGLPAIARSVGRHRRWWEAEASAYHAWYGWRGGGWHVAAVDLAAETVTFVRVGADG